MKNKIILIILTLLRIFTSTSKAQGIIFEKGANWPQVLAKAKAEHKYVFVDCYATWCGPCKEMDQEIYPLTEIGDVYNKQFISVKIQMDKTSTDKDTIKSWYVVGDYLAKTYHVNAYPTFLFFDPDGKPVHKSVGTKDPKEFIQLAGDAQNLNKQYYSVLKNFKPGTLDTTEEKSLVSLYTNSDKVLAGKIALDYFNRVPLKCLADKGNQRLIIALQDDPQILAVSTAYFDNLNQADFSEKANLQFISSLSKQPAIHERAIKYIINLNDNDFSKSTNLGFTSLFYKDSIVRRTALNYIAKLSDDQLFTKDNIRFIERFTETPLDNGFVFFYKNAKKINHVMKDPDYAQYVVANVISKSEFNPVFEYAKKSDKTPNFDSIAWNITNKYNSYFAKRTVVNGKADWYKFLVDKKNQDQYWPEFIDCKIKQIEFLGEDTTKSQSLHVNNVVYDIFLHCNDPQQLRMGKKWMKLIVDRNQVNDRFYPNYLDTYACMLYKSGQVSDAIGWEEKNLRFSIDHKMIDQSNLATKTIAKMKKGEQIWLEKEYQ